MYVNSLSISKKKIWKILINSIHQNLKFFVEFLALWILTILVNCCNLGWNFAGSAIFWQIDIFQLFNHLGLVGESTITKFKQLYMNQATHKVLNLIGFWDMTLSLFEFCIIYTLSGYETNSVHHRNFVDYKAANELVFHQLMPLLYGITYLKILVTTV